LKIRRTSAPWRVGIGIFGIHRRSGLQSPALSLSGTEFKEQIGSLSPEAGNVYLITNEQPAR
jgi:hypothetical protein